MGFERFEAMSAIHSGFQDKPNLAFVLIIRSGNLVRMSSTTPPLVQDQNSHDRKRTTSGRSQFVIIWL
jgi:hypothetical protein